MLAIEAPENGSFGWLFAETLLKSGRRNPKAPKIKRTLKKRKIWRAVKVKLSFQGIVF